MLLFGRRVFLEIVHVCPALVDELAQGGLLLACLHLEKAGYLVLEITILIPTPSSVFVLKLTFRFIPRVSLDGWPQLEVYDFGIRIPGGKEILHPIDTPPQTTHPQ